MSTIGTDLLEELQIVIGRTVFTKEEEALVELYLTSRVTEAFEHSVIPYKKQIQTLEDMIDFEDLGGNYSNMLEGL